MATVTPNSLAAGVAVGVSNEVLNPASTILDRKIVLIGVADAAKISGGLTANSPKRVFSAEEVGVLAGQGTVLHRLAIAAFAGSRGAETWIVPQSEGGTDAAATGTITPTVTTAKSGTIHLYVGAVYVPVGVTSGDDSDAVADAIAAAVNANVDLPVTAAVSTGVVTLTAKSKGVFGNDVSIFLNLNDESDVEGVTIATTDMQGGTGVVDIQDALDALGIGDNSNEKHFTALLHGNGKDAATIDAISAYNGLGNTQSGNYDKLVGRPFRSLIGTVDNDLSVEIAFTDARKEDRTTGMLSIPNSPNHPAEVAALALGIMEAENAQLAEAAYFDITLPGVYAGASRWSDEYNARDTAVKSGVSPTTVKNGGIALQNVVTFYRPDSVPAANNGYRSMRNISITQNVLNQLRTYFSTANWRNTTIVQNAARVTNPASQRRVKDIQAVKNALLFNAGQMEANGWLFSLDQTQNGLAKEGSVVYRTGGTGFDYFLELVYSGEGGILNGLVIFDINFGA